MTTAGYSEPWRAPTPPRFIGQSTWMSRMEFKPKRFGTRIFTNSKMR